jgi:CHAT domain-containing protein
MSKMRTPGIVRLITPIILQLLATSAFGQEPDKNASLQKGRSLEIKASEMERDGNRDEALNLLEQASSIYAETLGETHTETINSIVKQAVNRWNASQPDRAESRFRRALKLMQSSRGETHVDTVNLRVNIGFVLLQQGRAKDAEEFYRGALAILKQFHPDSKGKIAEINVSLAETLLQTVRYEEGESFARDALDAYLSMEHEQTNAINARRLLGWALYHQRKFPEAEDAVLPATKVLIESPETDSDLLENVYTLLWKIQIEREKYTEAAGTLQEEIELLRSKNSSMATVPTLLLQLAECYRMLGDPELDVTTSLKSFDIAELQGESQRHFAIHYADALVQRLLLDHRLQEAEQLAIAASTSLTTMGENDDTLSASLYLAAGKASYSQAAWDRAGDSFRKALDFSDRMPEKNYSVWSECRNYFVECLLKQERYAEAVHESKIAYDLSKTNLGGENGHALNSARLYGLALAKLEQRDLAINVLISVSDQINLHPGSNPDLEVSVLYALAPELIIAGKFEDATKLVRRSIAGRSVALPPLDDGTVAIHQLLIDILARQGKPEEAEDLTCQLIDEILGDSQHLYPPLFSRLVGCIDRIRTLEHAQRYLEILDKQLSHLPEPPLDALLAVLQRLAQNYEWQSLSVDSEAVVLRQISLLDTHRPNDTESIQSAINFLALSLSSQRKFIEAERVYRQILEDRQKSGDGLDSFICTLKGNLAYCLSEQGRDIEASQLFEESLSEATSVYGEDAPRTGLAHNNLAYHLLKLRQWNDAEKHFRDAIRIWETAAEGPVFNALSGIGNCQFLSGDLESAEKTWRLNINALDASGDLHPQKRSVALSNLATALYYLGKETEALELLELAVDQERSLSERSGLRGIARSSATHFSHAVARVALAVRSGQGDRAWFNLEESLAAGLSEEIAVVAQHSKSNEKHEQLKSVQAELLELEDRLERSIVNSELEEGILVDDRVLSLRQELVRLRHELRMISKNGERITMSTDSIQQCLDADAAFVGWVDIHGRAGTKNASGEHWGFVLRRSGPPRWVRLPGSGDGENWTQDDHALAANLAEQLRERPTAASRKQLNDLIAGLRKQRIEPLLEGLGRTSDLPAVSTLIVLPADTMLDIPVEVLAPEYIVSYAPSATTYAWIRSRPRAIQYLEDKKDAEESILVLADPVFGTRKQRKSEVTSGYESSLASLVRGMSESSEEYEHLPGTRFEALQIKASAESSSVLVTELFGSEATVSNVRKLAQSNELSNYNVIHFATHAIPDLQQSMRSYLVLSSGVDDSPGNNSSSMRNQRITAEEILLNWRLTSDMVVLSACQTGLGRSSPGEGRLGFSQALLVAGSRSVILSQWKVDDSATALLMTRFYQNLFGSRAGYSGRMTKGAALHEAKQWLRDLDAGTAESLLASSEQFERGTKSSRRLPITPSSSSSESFKPFSDPYYWAGFVLTGVPN